MRLAQAQSRVAASAFEVSLFGIVGRCRIVSVAVAALCVVRGAFAQAPVEVERARAQFQEALSLEVAGDFSTALSKLQQVAKVRLTPQVRYHFARCKERLGRLTEALGDYRIASTEARAAGLSEVSEFERARIALESRVPRLHFQLNTDTDRVAIELDGVLMRVSHASSAIPVDPGLRRVAYRGHDGERIELEVATEEGKTSEIVLPATGHRAAQPTASATVTPSGAPAWAYVSATVGSVAVVSSIVLFVVRSEALNKLESACTNSICPDDMRSTADRGKLASWAAPTALGLGVGALALATWGLWPRDTSQPELRRASSFSRVAIAAAPTFTGIRVTSEF